MLKAKYLAAVLVFCCAVPFSRANTIITNPGPGTPNLSIGATTAGFDFTVGSTPLSITALGVWDQNRNGLANSHTVGLWDISGNLLAQALISPGTVNPLTGDFRYATLATPVTLLAGSTYVLGATYVNFDLDRLIVNNGGNQASFDSAIFAGNFRQVIGPTNLTFPNSNIQAGSGVGPNAQFALLAVPEVGPGVLLVGLVLGAFFLVHRRTIRA